MYRNRREMPLFPRVADHFAKVFPGLGNFFGIFPEIPLIFTTENLFPDFLMNPIIPLMNMNSV